MPMMIALPVLMSSLALAAPAAPLLNRVERSAFNRAAVRLNLPVYWVADSNANGAVDPDEVAALLFYPETPRWVEDGRFTPAFEKAYAEIAAWSGEPSLPPALAPGEQARRQLVIADLDQGRPSLVRSDLRQLSSEDRVLVRHMLALASLVDDLYAIQTGAALYSDRVPVDDPSSQSLLRRNWTPACVAPKTEANPNCSAVPGAPRALYGGYPNSLQSDPGFCAALQEHADAATLMDPFTVVRELDGRLAAISVTEAYRKQTAAIAAELHAAARDIKDEKEASLKAYLDAAAQGFETNSWFAADEAWAKMNAQNSRWYLRVAPDEVYRDPCRLKGGFHLTFARINPESLSWQEKLTPLQQRMEHDVAALAGAPYAERRVTFHLPDFIDIVINAGDDRHPIGGTIGQSLPNWGPVANEGRGRTVVMTNLFNDLDSRTTRRQGAESLLDAASLQNYSELPAPGLLNIILHEAMHNLGPSSEYKVGGKTDRQIFGGPLASTLEELKAQTGALWLIDLLRGRGVADETLARQAYVNDVVWAFGHIASGMYEGNDRTRPKPYSQLAAVQLVFLLDEGAVTWDAESKAANGQDAGCFALHLERMPAAAEKLMRLVAGIKARGDRTAAEDLLRRFVDGGAERHALIAERLRRQPKSSLVYAIDL
ncbi:MAG: hypothetical protein JXO72_08960 [Vicinamibacteria bacterium]|nr:hypothetical protein [Vicinamibacteria bacterium]